MKTTTKLRSKTVLLPTLLASALLAAGCGGGGGGSSANPAVTPSVNSAVDQCLKQAKQVKDPSARKTAEAACNAVKSGDTGKVKSAAKAQCLAAVNQIPDSAMQQKDAARARCNAIK